ncbi:hypothetical protein [Alloalcanivorax profundimaris]|uniref:hypothetical protein n=1 Tax=Alloalcanivorax profundimaris TaxID=2735259 RepID=UPI000C4E5AF3|nr:hypothetical protein [Alloalcanivorax profundimaris]MAO59986.1 hypothetical protein [Alcanivorax sp.]MBM1144719.1 hypothetical protein [Alcanivorax sp. ZXX171]MCQ6263085.1 hypothetical protein [Alcanivorax sp. MM125-6]UWN47933.1 hypothetical protein ASALC70_00107 [Alcanivorax sp. ALC70]MAY09278.1 hypothetical protein [Alcanivorax sp.]|tara:strand:+ start:44032 stop:44937 length:906 start_codon:yes stop_codon:yes gene_type:complete
MRLFALAILLLFTATAQAERFFGELDAVSEPVLGARTGLIEEMDRDSLRVNADAGTSVELPTQCVSSALMARSHTRFSALFPRDGADRARRMQGQGSSITEAGLTLDRAFGAERGYQLDAVFKAQRSLNYHYDLPAMADFNPLLQEQDSYTESQGFNIDTRLSKTFGDLDMALRVEKLFPRRDGDLVYSPYRTTALASLATYLDPAWWWPWPSAKLNINIDARDAFNEADDARFAGANLAFAQLGFATLRLGYRHDLIANLDSSASVGLGFSLFDRFDFDISGTKNPGDSYGVRASLMTPL